jgi:hypothetical protein
MCSYNLHVQLTYIVIGLLFLLYIFYLDFTSIITNNLNNNMGKTETATIEIESESLRCLRSDDHHVKRQRKE